MAGLAGSQLGYLVAHQSVELDIDFEGKSLEGKTEITIHPLQKDLKSISLNFRHGEINRLSVNGKQVEAHFVDPCRSLRLYGVHQHHKLASKVESLLSSSPTSELTVHIPKSVRIEELDPLSFEAQSQLPVKPGDGDEAVDSQPVPKADALFPKFTALTIYIEYSLYCPRDGVHFVGMDRSEHHYPHVFTMTSTITGEGFCLFPCVQDLSSRCTWDFSVRCPRTVGDAFRKTHRLADNHRADDSESLEIVVVCSGDMTDEILDKNDHTKKVVSFSCSTPLSSQQIGFTAGPFEYVNLTQFRESDEDEQLGQNAVPVHAFCLPGRADEVRNTCFPIAKAIDFISLNYGSYPFSSYKLCFVDDGAFDTAPYATLAVCSTRLLFPHDIIDPLYDSTRTLVHAVASQWMGVNVIQKEATDTWVIVGVAYYITDTFMKKLCGNNEFRFRLKQASDHVCDLDVTRPSIWDMGTLLRLDPSELEFLALKAPLVLYILERRLSKASGKATVSRIISRIFLNARMGDIPHSALTTAFFQKLCERFGHVKLDAFFQQWVYGAGCPRFVATQRFNKKKLVVEMMIRQVQSEQPSARNLNGSTFMREVKEELQNVYAGALQHVFTGSMTIRIHEADGTPYEHIVEIKEAVTKFDIPYNTKYKRLKRNKRQKERAAVSLYAEPSSEAQDDVLFYCLGDVLQSEEDMQKWRLVEWTKEDEDRMGQESYEWIRMDADFEWICGMSLAMPGYMYLSQLQQERDVVAQLESIQYMATQREHPLISTIFVRTLMDKRYFHGIRSAAAHALVKHAKEEVDWIGLFHLETAFKELFCLPNSPMTRSNDFSDRASYALQLSIPQAISKVRDSQNNAPRSVKQSLYEKLKFNDNSNNKYSDCHYVATLMRCIADALFGEKENCDDGHEFSATREPEDQAEHQLHLDCLAEIDRYKRMDEWTSSYQNLYTRAAIDCQWRLIRMSRADLFTMAEFLPYTRAGTFEMLRLDAFRVLLDRNIFQCPELLQWLLYSMSMDTSAWLRRELHRAFGRALASLAFNENNTPSTATNDELIVEKESSTDARKAKLERMQTVPGAIDALRGILADSITLREFIWAACNSPNISLTELRDFLYICAIIYDPIDQKIVTLRYPKYWMTKHLGNGKMKFSRSPRYRTRPIKSTQQGTGVQKNQPSTKRKGGDNAKTTPASRKITLKIPKLAYLTCPSSPKLPPPSGLPKLKLKIRAPKEPEPR